MSAKNFVRLGLVWGLGLFCLSNLWAGTVKRVLVAPLAIPKSTYTGTIANGVPSETRYSISSIRRQYEDIWGPFWETASHGKFLVQPTVVDYTFAQWPLGVQTGVSYKNLRWYTQKFTDNQASIKGELYTELKATDIGDGVWTPGERYIDQDGDGLYTRMEAWSDCVDLSTGGTKNTWDIYGEEFADYDGDLTFSANVNLTVYAQDRDLGTGEDALGNTGDGFVGPVSAGNLAVRTIRVSELDLNIGGHMNASSNIYRQSGNLTGDRSFYKYDADADNVAPVAAGAGILTAADGTFDLPLDSNGNGIWTLVTAIGTVSYKTVTSGNIQTKTVTKYRAPEKFTDTKVGGPIRSDNKKWDDRDPFEDFMVRWEPWYQPKTSPVPTGGWVPVTKTYIDNNYPGNKTALWDRTNNKNYSPAEDFADEFNDKMKVTYNAAQIPLPVCDAKAWDPHRITGGGGGTIANLNNWFTYVFGEALDNNGTKKSKWISGSTTMVAWDISEFDGDRGRLITPDTTKNPFFDWSWATFPKTPATETYSVASFQVYNSIGVVSTSANLMPDSKKIYYDGPREFRDLPSSIYHKGGDMRFGEQTDPRSASIFGTDYGDSADTTVVFPDFNIEMAGPLAYNIQGDKGNDAGNQALIELLTWNTAGTFSANTDATPGTNTFVDKIARVCRDNNCDGLIDQGLCPPKNFNNYLMDNIGQRGDGVGDGYPFNRNRLLEDIAEYTDNGLDFDKFSDSPLRVDYVVMGIASGYQGGSFQGLSGLSQSITTLDDNVSQYTFAGQPDQGFDVGKVSCHEMNHDFWGSTDLYDFDGFNGIRANNPIGTSFDLMAAGGFRVTPITPLAGGYITLRDLKSILIPGVEQTINVYPHNYIKNDSSYYEFKSSARDGESFMFYYDNGQGYFSNGFNGLTIIHKATGTIDGDSAPAQQRIGNHFTYQVVEANGKTDMLEGITQGTQSSVWPYNGKVTFNNNYGEHPKSQWWDGKDSGIEIRNIVLPKTNAVDQPVQVTFYLKNLFVPELTFINPPGGESAAGFYSLRYNAFDVFGGSNIFFYRDTATSGYAGTYLGTVNKNVSGEIEANFNTWIASLSDNGYRFYAMLEPGKSENGTNAGNYVSSKLLIGAGSITNIVVKTDRTGTANQQSSLQDWTLECVTAGGTGVGKFTATGSVTGLEASKITVGTAWTAANPFTGLTLTINATKDFGVGDRFVVRTTGWTPYSQSILVVNGATVVPDNSQPGVIVSSLSNKVSEGGTTATFTVKMSGVPTKDVTVTLSSSNTGEATVAPTTLLFTPELSDSKAYWKPQTVTVTGIDDTVVDGDQNFNIKLALTSTDTNFSIANAATVAGINVDNELFGVEYLPEDQLTYESNSSNIISETVWFRLKSRPLKNVVISVASNNTAEGKLASSSVATFTFTPDNWNSLQKFSICGVEDTAIDGDKEYAIVLTMVSEDNNYNGITSKLKLTNFDNEIPDVIISKLSNDLQESGVTGTFTIQLTAKPSDNVNVKFATNDPTVAITDTRSLVFSPTNYGNPQTVTVIPMENTGTSDGTASIQFETLVSNDTNYSGIKPSSVAVTVKDNDSYGYTISKPTNQPDENGRESLIYFYLNKATTGNVIIDVGVNDLTEASFSPAQLVFDSTNWNGRQVISVIGLDDTLVDGNLPFDVLLTVNSASTDANYRLLDPKDVSLVNIDNDTPNVIVDITDRFSDEYGDYASFSVYCTQAPVSGNINLVTVSDDPNEGDFSGGSSNLVFNANNFNVLQSAYVLGIKDNKEDGNSSYQLTQTLSGNATYAALVLPKLALVNRSTEVPYVLVGPLSGETSELGSTATFRVKLLRAPAEKNVVISLTCSDNSEATVTSSLTFTPTNYQSPQTVTVTGVSDSLKDGDVPYYISFSVSSEDTNYNKFTVPPVRLFNKDKDQIGVNVGIESSLTTEAGGNVQLKFKLFTAPTSTVLLTLTTSDNTEGSFSADGTTDSKTVFFTTNSWQTEKTVTVYGVDDGIFDGDIPYSIRVETSSPDSLYNKLFIPRINLTNVDNDNPKVLVSDNVTKKAVDFSTGYSITEGSSANLVLSLQQPPTGTVALDVAISSNTTVNLSLNGGVTKSANVLMTYTAATYSVNQQLTLVSLNDSLINTDRAYNLTISVNTTLTTDTFGYKLLNVVPIELRELNDDIPKVVMSSVSTSGNTSEVGGIIVMSLSLATIPDYPVKVALTNGDSTEVTLSTSSLTFNGASSTTSQSVVITGINDSIEDGDIPVDITFAVTSADSNYGGLAVSKFSFTNIDLPRLLITNASGANISRTATTSINEGFSSNVYLSLSKTPSADVVYDVKISDNTLLNLSLDGGTTKSGNVLVKFTTSTSSTNQVLTLVSKDDITVYPSATYSLSFAINTALTKDTSGYALYKVEPVKYTLVENDIASVVVTSPSIHTTETGGSSTFTVALGTIPTSTTTITITNGNSAEVTLGTSVLSFAADSTALTPQTVTLTGKDDSVDDGNKNVSLAFSISTKDSTYSILAVSPLIVTNDDDDTAAITVDHSSFNSSIKEGSAATFSVVLKSQPTSSVTLTITVTNPDKFLESVSASSLTFTTSNWSTAQVVTVQTMDDGVVGPATKSPKPTLAFSSSSGDALYNNMSSLSSDTFEVTITEDDSNSLNVDSFAGNTLHEDGQSLVSRVRLGAQITSGNVVIDIASGNPNALEVLTPKVVLDGNTWMSGKSFKLRGVIDFDTLDANVLVTLSVNSSFSTTSFPAANVTGHVVVKDLDRKEVLVKPQYDYLDENSGSRLSLTVQLAASPVSGETVTVTPAATGNIKISPSSLTFDGTNYRGYGYFTLSSNVNEPKDVLTTLTFTVTGSAGSYNGVSVSPITLTVRDLDISSVILWHKSGDVTSEDGASQVVYFKLSKIPTSTVSLALLSSDVTEVSLSTSTLTFTTSNFATEQSVTLTGKEDAIKDGPIDYKLYATATNGGYDGLSKTINFKNLDNDSADFRVSHVSTENTFEGGAATKTITVKSLTTPASAVNVAVSVNNDEGLLNTNTLSFGGTNSNSQSLVVSGNSDILTDGHQPFTVRFGNSTSSDNSYSGLPLEDVDVINFDDKLVGLDFYYPVSPLTPVKAGAFTVTTSELSGNASKDKFSFALHNSPLGESNVIFNVLSSNTNEGWVTPATLVFDSINWSVPQEVTVVGQKGVVSDTANYVIRLVVSTDSTDSVYRYLPEFNVKALNQPVNTIITASTDLGSASNGEYIANLIKISSLTLSASNGLAPYTWSVSKPVPEGDLVSLVSGSGNTTLTISSLGTQTGTYTITVTDSQTIPEVKTYKLYVQGSPKIAKITRPTVNTVKLNFNDVANSSRNYLVYASADGVTWKLVGGPISPVVSSSTKPRMAPSSVTSYDVTVGYEGSISSYFKLQAVDSTNPSLAAPSLPNSTSGTLYTAVPPADTTTDKNLGGSSSGGGGGGCVLR